MNDRHNYNKLCTTEWLDSFPGELTMTVALGMLAFKTCQLLWHHICFLFNAWHYSCAVMWLWPWLNRDQVQQIYNWVRSRCLWIRSSHPCSTQCPYVPTSRRYTCNCHLYCLRSQSSSMPWEQCGQLMEHTRSCNFVLRSDWCHMFWGTRSWQIFNPSQLCLF